MDSACAFLEAVAPARGRGLQGVQEVISGAAWLGPGPRVFLTPRDADGLYAVSALFEPAPCATEDRSRAYTRP
eukprot:15438502-Alexandrium_andersonii.AAC.1